MRSITGWGKRFRSDGDVVANCGAIDAVDADRGGVALMADEVRHRAVLGRPYLLGQVIGAGHSDRGLLTIGGELGTGSAGDIQFVHHRCRVRWCHRTAGGRCERQILLWTPVLRTCRLCIAEADRLPQASAQYYDTYFTATHERLAEFLAERCQLHSSISINIAHELLALTVYPRFARALFGVEETLTELPDATAITAPLDLAPIREVVTALLPSTEVTARS